MPLSGTSTPTVFISYSWESPAHKEWVRDFASQLRADGVEVTLDQWKLVPGDQLAQFMEREIGGVPGQLNYGGGFDVVWGPSRASTHWSHPDLASRASPLHGRP